MSDFIPVLDYLLVKQRAKENTGAIQLLKEELTQEADVVATGPGFVCEQTGEHIEMTVKAGDIIMFPSGGGQSVVIDDYELLMVRERDIFGILIPS